MPNKHWKSKSFAWLYFKTFVTNQAHFLQNITSHKQRFCASLTKRDSGNQSITSDLILIHVIKVKLIVLTLYNFSLENDSLMFSLSIKMLNLNALNLTLSKANSYSKVAGSFSKAVMLHHKDSRQDMQWKMLISQKAGVVQIIALLILRYCDLGANTCVLV